MRVLALAVVLLACSGKKEDGRRVDQPKTTRREPVAPAPEQPVPETPVFPEGTHSLELTRTVGVRITPGDDAKRIGTIAIDTRVGWTSTSDGKGCQKPWVEIKPRGWVCSDYMKPSTKPPFGREVPMLDRGEIVPGVYGKVTAPNTVTYVVAKPEKKEKKKKGPVTQPSETEPTEPKLIEGKPLVGSINVRQYDEVTFAGKPYWRIAPRDQEFIPRSAITPHRPSVFGGTRMSDDTGIALPIAFVWPRVQGWQQASTMNKATGGGVARQLAKRTPLAILETATDKSGKPTAYRIGASEWIRAADVRMFSPLPAPKQLAKTERWIDVDLDDQILVAYEGDLPVYATLLSSGAKDAPTETGIYRMWLKESEADMKGLNGEDPYSVATVPWTQFYSPERGLALHTAYWHDQFGTRRSRGCLNLAPRDARWLYFWSDPQVPPGWTMAAGIPEAPGSLVRVRSKEDPEPPVRGYAKQVLELRQQGSTIE
jgi:hypothetical protein